MRHGASLLLVALTGLIVSCGGGGGGSGGGGGGGVAAGDAGSTGTVGAVAPSQADQQVQTFATTGRDGGWSQVDLVPVSAGSPGTGPLVNPLQAALLAALQTLSGTDLNNNWAGASPALPTTGFDTYITGLAPGSFAGFILAANNLYDMFQTSTGLARLSLILTPPPAFVFNGFTGGDISSDGLNDGGSGLFSNIAALLPGRAVPPKAATLPNTMGAAAPASGRGPSPTDEHQFIQIVFPYPLDASSLFNCGQGVTSFLGDSLLADNVIIQANGVRRLPPDAVNVFGLVNSHVSGVAVIGGVTAVPIAGCPAAPILATIDANPLSPTFGHVPTGARALIGLPNVFTYIAHESPAAIPASPGPAPIGVIGHIDFISGNLILPNPTAGLGGRVFGGPPAPGVPSSVNDFLSNGDQTAAGIGFVSIEIKRLRSNGTTINNPYFHTFPVDQAQVGADTRAVNGSFNRGPAIAINAATQIPRIDVLDPTADVIGVYNAAPLSDADAAMHKVSTRARFRVDFDREVVPNSVGFSRRHTIHSVAAQGTVFPFNGNTRPNNSPSGQFVGSVTSPIGPSIFLAVTQPAGINRNPASPLFNLVQKTNSPFAKVNGGNFDDGTAFSLAQQVMNGLNPTVHNSLAQIVRGVVPCDIYPLNQNNLQSYIIEPLVELPPNVVLTLGVSTAGLGTTKLGRTGVGNFTRSGTVYTTFQGLNAVAVGEDPSQKQFAIANETLIKVNAGPMDLQGNLFFGGTAVAIDRLVNGNPADDLTIGGFNVARTFRTGADNVKRYINAPVSPQALYLGFSTGGLGVLDLNGTGYNTNVPGGSLLNTNKERYTQVSRFLPALTHTGALAAFNYTTSGAVANGGHFEAFGLLGRYTSGTGPLAGNIESENGIGAAIGTGSIGGIQGTSQPGINEGSSGYETLVFSGITGGNPATATSVFLSPILRDMEVGDFLDTVFFDKDNSFASFTFHRSYNTPTGGGTVTNLISDPPIPNPPPLRFPVGLPHTYLLFDQANLAKAPRPIEGNEVFPADGFMNLDDGSGNGALGSAAINGLIQLNPASNLSNGGSFDIPHLPKAGFNFNFGFLSGSAGQPKFVQTGPMPETATSGTVILTTLNNGAPGTASSGGLKPPVYQSRQQIGNYLFAADGVNRKLLAINSNTMDVLHSLSLPDPYGLGLTADLRKLFVSNEGDNSVSIVDSNPTSPFFMTEIKRTKVGGGPRAVTCGPDGEDVFVLNYADNTVSIIEQVTGTVRKTLQQSGLNRPYDMACGMREVAAQVAFQSGTYHGFISNNGGQDTLSSPSVVVFESGPTGQGGLGFDSIIGGVITSTSEIPNLQKILAARGITYDPQAKASDGALSLGAFVAHKTATGRAAVSRISYYKDLFPGQNPVGSILSVFGGKEFEVVSQYVSTFLGEAYDVALPDYNRTRFENNDFAQFNNLYNAGGTTKSTPITANVRNSKFPLADVPLAPGVFNHPRWEPDRLYLSVSGKIIEVFDLNGAHLKTITTPKDVSVLTTYFSQ
ncbi:MAG: YncE family protein [Planctomycetota bacterium]